MGVILLSRAQLAVAGDVCSRHDLVLLASSGSRPGMLLNIL